MYVHFDVSARDLNRFSCIIAFFVSDINLPDEYLSLSWDKNILFPLLLQQVTGKIKQKMLDGWEEAQLQLQAETHKKL